MGLFLRSSSLANPGNAIAILPQALTYNQADGNFMYLLTNMSGSNINITGSTGIVGPLTVTGNITANNLIGTASWATNAVNALSASQASTASYVLNAISASFASNAAQAATASYVLNAVSSSFASTASYVLNAVSASWAPMRAAGTDTQIQFNSGSTFSGDATFRFIYTSQSLEQGNSTQAIGLYSHAEGISTTARGFASHAEGVQAQAIGNYSHAEGQQTRAVGIGTHAEGQDTITSGSYSHTEGSNTLTTVDGAWAHAAGFFTIASGWYQSVIGQYNISSSAQSAFIIGNGTSNSNRRNLLFASGSQVQITGSLDVSGSGRFTNGLTVTGSLTVSGSGTFTNIGITSLTGSLNVTGSTTQTGNNTLIGNTVLSGSITVSGSSDFKNSTFIVTGSSYFKGYHEVSGSTNVTGSLSVIGDLNVVSGSSFLRWGNKLFNYGSFYHTASITPTQNVSGSFIYSTTTESEGVSIVNGSRITFDNTGKYNIQFSAQVSTPTAADVHIWLKSNGTNVADTAGRITTSNNDNMLPSWNYVLSVSSGSYLEIAYQTTATNTTFPYIAATGNIPGIPSIIVTVTQVA